MTERKAYQTSLIILQKLFQDLQPMMSLPIEKNSIGSRCDVIMNH